MILGEVKARPKDIISFSLDYISKSKVQTSNPSSSPIPLDTPARPADLNCFFVDHSQQAPSLTLHAIISLSWPFCVQFTSTYLPTVSMCHI